MKGQLKEIIMDRDTGLLTDDDETDDESPGRKDKEMGPRRKSVFWKEIVKEVKKKGSRAVVGVTGQFASFEKTQPG